MNHDNLRSHRWRNLMHSVLLLGAMVLLLASIGRLFFGAAGIFLAVAAVAALFTLGRVSPRWVLRLHRARPLHPHQAPGLHRLVGDLAGRARLHAAPDLYLVPSPALNAFAAGKASESAIGVSQGLLASLDRRQLAGVLAHEISHIRHHDLWVMGLAQLLGSMTRNLSLFGQLMLLLAAPALVLGGYQVPWAALMLVIAAPTVSALLQLALSRTREFEADLGATRLTGDPLGLASALDRLEAHQGGWWRVFFPAPRRRETTLLDSHPATAERIARLRSLVDRPLSQVPARRGPMRWDAEPLSVPVRVVRAPRVPVRWLGASTAQPPAAVPSSAIVVFDTFLTLSEELRSTSLL